MIVEVFIASLALFLWLEVQPGIVKAVLYNVMLIAGISTVLFNGNPLLRYDGYYILSDLIQIPNLRNRANQYLGHLVETRLFGLQLPVAEASRGERRWFVFFAIASFLYRTFIMLAIAVFIASEYMFLGVLLALWAGVTAFVFPVARGIGYLLMHSRLRRNRLRAIAASGAIVGAAALLLLALPLPHWIRAEGVIWVPEGAQVRAGADGFVKAIAVEPGTLVGRGRPLLVAENFELASKMRVLEAQLRMLETRSHAELQNDRVRWEITREEIKATREELEHTRRLHRELTIVSPTSGSFVLSVAAQDLPERYLRKGQEIGYVVPAAAVTARVLVSQDDVDLVRTSTREVRVKLAGRMYETFSATVRREVPAASNSVGNLAMSSVGGGRAPLDPQDTKNPKTLQTWFEFELELPATRAFVLGEHVYARFELAPEPLAWRIYRSVRQLFLQRFAI
jgi:putative peptide zinc metalloprotease protein